MAILDVSTLDLDGRVVVDGDEDWDEARQGWNLAADQRPAAVVQAAHARDVAATVRFAAEHGLRVAPQTTGHAATELPPLDDTILLRTGALDAIEVDPGPRSARVGGGVLALAAAEACQPHGLTPLLGSAVDVGVAGFAVGGGLGWLAREHGLACNAVRSATLVIGSGEEVRVDAESDPDLFWAIRGGGGAFGVVTELEVDLVDGGDLLAGDVMFAVADAPGVFATYLDWAKDAPANVTSSIRLLTPPPVPDVPEPLRGTPLVTVTAAVSGDADEAEELLASVRGSATPIHDAFGRIPAAGLCRIHGDPEQPVPGLTGGCTLDSLGSDTVDAVLDMYPGSGLLQVDFRQLGGALATSAERAGVLSRLPGAYAVASVGVTGAPEQLDQVREGLAALDEVLAPAQSDVRFLNFDDEPGDGANCFTAEDYARLRDVKARVDPENVVRGGKDIQPA